jgi:phosphoribosylformylglycinamidine cyclo-ligase
VSTYKGAGVAVQGDALSSVMRHLGPTLAFPEGAEALTSFGAYASVLQISADVAVAVSTDGVGSKTMVASALDRYDTIGFDCVAMNANDVVCVGARPIAMLDYLAVNKLDARRADDVLRGLGAAAKEAGIAIPGGEIAQLPEIIGPRDERAFDLVGTCLGILHPRQLLIGASVAPGDAIIGVASSGIHSNGLSLARHVLMGTAGYRLGDEIPRLGCTLGEELLRPTEIYVRAVSALRTADVAIRGLAHITGDGLANLCRIQTEAGYAIERLPARPEIFALIQESGDVDDAEMYRVFNMGVGFAVIAPQRDAEATVEVLGRAGYRADRIGSVSDEAGVVRIEPAGLIGGLAAGDGVFRPL